MTGIKPEPAGAQPDALAASGKPLNRTEGFGAIGNSWAFAAAVEAALGIEPPPAAVRPRAVALELERLYNHVFTDIPIIEASFWLTVAGTAR